MLVRLHVFYFLSHSHNAKTLSCIWNLSLRQQWCHRLKAVLIAVYWLRVHGNFIYIVRVKMAMGNSAKGFTELAFLITLLYLLIFIANTCLPVYVGR